MAVHHLGLVWIGYWPACLVHVLPAHPDQSYWMTRKYQPLLPSKWDPSRSDRACTVSIRNKWYTGRLLITKKPTWAAEGQRKEMQTDRSAPEPPGRKKGVNPGPPTPFKANPIEDLCLDRACIRHGVYNFPRKRQSKPWSCTFGGAWPSPTNTITAALGSTALGTGSGPIRSVFGTPGDVLPSCPKPPAGAREQAFLLIGLGFFVKVVHVELRGSE